MSAATAAGIGAPAEVTVSTWRGSVTLPLEITELGVRGKNPRWSPDGALIVAELADNPGLWLIEPTAQARSVQLHDAGTEPRWSPDGSRIAAIDPDKELGLVLRLDRAATP